MEVITTEVIAGKSVYIFENHATAFAAWSDYRRKVDSPPNLITLDTHTDTMTAFRNYLCWEINGIPDNLDEKSEEMCSRIDYCSDESVKDAVEKLQHDEQIDAAIKAGILNFAFVISYERAETVSIQKCEYQNLKKYSTKRNEDGSWTIEFSRPDYDFETPVSLQTYEIPEDKIFIVSPYTGFEREGVDITEEYNRRHADIAIESDYLDAKMEVIDRMSLSCVQNSFRERDYILDIDLDYFRTEKSARPDDARTFYRLIRNAKAITIATEPDFIGYEKLDGENISSETLLPEIISHIHTALDSKG